MRKILSMLLMLQPAALFAHGYGFGDLVVAHPIVFETPQTAQTGAGYLTIFNNGATDDVLIAVKADFPRVTLHQTIMQGDIASMADIDGIPVPALKVTTLEPGGAHVMFMGLAGDPFEVGEEIKATLVFAEAGEIDVVFRVEARSDDKPVDHSNH
ncbi:copper chaperone PCu(A)C [Cognatiyoonia sp. IB215182]|uniref:copper chaperone PCu(A)C n=1 Tax=Cognatiyoonia sp. IB215182 TaxID=3097353 RepID=UPI002A12CC73|nr:copper chaperone PCu(A)C [Cognatiyoonia sp. IB215182]MDX8353205.1 copper chaperone PCu(A)C [Cognatiyoonia sp. IB215182]